MAGFFISNRLNLPCLLRMSEMSSSIEAVRYLVPKKMSFWGNIEPVICFLIFAVPLV